MVESNRQVPRFLRLTREDFFNLVPAKTRESISRQTSLDNIVIEWSANMSNGEARIYAGPDSDYYEREDFYRHVFVFIYLHFRQRSKGTFMYLAFCQHDIGKGEIPKEEKYDNYPRLLYPSLSQDRAIIGKVKRMAKRIGSSIVYGASYYHEYQVLTRHHGFRIARPEELEPEDDDPVCSDPTLVSSEIKRAEDFLRGIGLKEREEKKWFVNLRQQSWCITDGRYKDGQGKIVDVELKDSAGRFSQPMDVEHPVILIYGQK